jgi:hypothetical protein
VSASIRSSSCVPVARRSPFSASMARNHHDDGTTRTPWCVQPRYCRTALGRGCSKGGCRACCLAAPLLLACLLMPPAQAQFAGEGSQPSAIEKLEHLQQSFRAKLKRSFRGPRAAPAGGTCGCCRCQTGRIHIEWPVDNLVQTAEFTQDFDALPSAIQAAQGTRFAQPDEPVSARFTDQPEMPSYISAEDNGSRPLYNSGPTPAPGTLTTQLPAATAPATHAQQPTGIGLSIGGFRLGTTQLTATERALMLQEENAALKKSLQALQAENQRLHAAQDRSRDLIETVRHRRPGGHMQD